MHGAGAHLLGKRRELAFGWAVAHDQPAAPLAQARVQVAQALQQELRPRAGCVAPVQQPVVEAEHRHHAIVGVERGPQSRLFVEAQVAPEPDDCCHRFGYAGLGGGDQRATRARAALKPAFSSSVPQVTRMAPAAPKPRSARTAKPSRSSRSASRSPSPSAVSA